MGRWAQRQRGGGGVNQPIVILNVTHGDTNEAVVTFSKPVTASNFSGFGWSSTPSAETADSFAQTAGQVITVTFNGDVDEDTELVYNDTVVNIVRPQTVPYS